MSTFETDVVDEALRTICTPCKEGRHEECEPVPCSADEDCKYRDCRCPCPGSDRIGNAIEHLRNAIAAAEMRRIDEARKHVDAARELLAERAPPTKRRIRGGLAIVRVPGRFYEASMQPDVIPIAEWMETKR
jgi:hypothetical protein